MLENTQCQNPLANPSKTAANILVGQDGRVQLCDFGVSAQLVGKSGKRNTFVGTPQWMAPEALTGGSYDSRIDIWSFGITTIEMATQNPPLYNIPPNRVVDMIPRRPPPRLEGGNWSNNLREFVALCLNEVPEERATVDELLRSKFVKGSKGIPSSLMRELIVRYEQWANRGGVRDSMWQAALQSDMDQLNATLASEPGWDFDTVKSRLSGVGEYIAKEIGSNVPTLKASYRVPPISESARQRTAEGLVRLFQSPEEEAQAMQNGGAGGAKMGLGLMGSSTDISFRSGASSRSTTPEQKISMISIPSFDDNGLRVPEKRAASPMSQIAIPSEDEAMRLAHAKASAPRSTPTPPLLDKDRAPMVRIRRNRADSAGASILRPNGISSSPTPPPTGPLPGPPTDTDRDVSPSPGRRPSLAASAPSSPPRVSNPLGLLKSHHLPSKSAPNIAAPGNGAPPLPTIRGGLVAGANGPHAKSRSQDITGLGLARGGVGMRAMANKPGNLNLDLPPGTNGNSGGGNSGMGILPPSPSRPYYPQHTPQGSFSGMQVIGLSGLASQSSGAGSMTSMTPSISGTTLRDGETGWGGSGGFPVIQPLDVGVLPLDGGDPRMLEELDRVLAGLGDALEVMQVGLKGMRRWSDREEIGESGEGES